MKKTQFILLMSTVKTGRHCWASNDYLISYDLSCLIDWVEEEVESYCGAGYEMIHKQDSFGLDYEIILKKGKYDIVSFTIKNMNGEEA